MSINTSSSNWPPSWPGVSSEAMARARRDDEELDERLHFWARLLSDKPGVTLLLDAEGREAGDPDDPIREPRYRIAGPCGWCGDGTAWVTANRLSGLWDVPAAA